MKIQPTYVTFKQAKLLKEKGFDVSCREGWYKAQLDPYKGKLFPDDTGCKHEIEKPEQWQVVEWLRINHDIHLWIETYADNITFTPHWCYLGNVEVAYSYQLSGFSSIGGSDYNTPQDAYSAAFDYILKELI